MYEYSSIPAGGSGLGSMGLDVETMRERRRQMFERAINRVEQPEPAAIDPELMAQVAQRMRLVTAGAVAAQNGQPSSGGGDQLPPPSSDELPPLVYDEPSGGGWVLPLLGVLLLGGLGVGGYFWWRSRQDED